MNEAIKALTREVKRQKKKVLSCVQALDHANEQRKNHQQNSQSATRTSLALLSFLYEKEVLPCPVCKHLKLCTLYPTYTVAAIQGIIDGGNIQGSENATRWQDCMDCDFSNFEVAE